MWTQETYLRAYLFAARAHQSQKFPGTDLPYIVHISFVSMETIAALNHESDRDGDLAVQCALLHDVIEDTGITFEMVKAEFGEKVAKGVLALTKNEALPKDERMGDSLRRIRQQPYEVWMVKMADRITNLAPPPPDWTGEKILRYREEAVEIHRFLQEASDYLARRLLTKINEYGEFV